MRTRYESARAGGNPFKSARLLLPFAPLLLSFAVSFAAPRQSGEETRGNQGEVKSETRTPARKTRTIVQEGVSIEFAIEPIYGGELLEGEDARVSFTITDARTNLPLNGLRPSAWMDFRPEGKTAEPTSCREKVRSFLQASLGSRPDIDLNSYYILALNEEATISVIDPLLGYGGSKLLTLVFLKSQGEDWVLSRDRRRLFVSMPKVNQVAVIDTASWKIEANIDAGPNPNRIVLQQDQKYLWVGNDADGASSGVTIVDTGDLKAVARIETGPGHHEIALDGGDRDAFVTNKSAGTISVIDVRKLSKIKDLKSGGMPGSLAYSPLGKAVYIANEDGGVTVVGGADPEVLVRIPSAPGLKTIRFTPDGRYGFVASQKEDSVLIIDSAGNRIIHRLEAGAKPEKISFTRDFAYVWSRGTEQVTMIRLDSIGKSGNPPTIDFPGGQAAPEQSPNTSIADSVVAAPENGAVLVANPVDKIIYYYSEGMAAPMGSFNNYGRAPRAVTVLDKSLREIRPGVYSTSIRLTGGGSYDAAFLLDSPRIMHCFDASWKSNPALAKRQGPPVRIESSIKETKIGVGENVKYQFKLLDSKTGEPKAGLKDVNVLVFLAPGTWQKRQWAAAVGEGYEVSFSPPETGVYYVFVQCPSLRVSYNQLPYIIFDARETGNSPSKTAQQN